MSRKYRIIHVGTGATGFEGLRSILSDPRLVLVGQFAHSVAKIGQDSGVIAGREPIGVRATNSWDELLALRADCVSYMANGAGREDDATAEIARFLAAGTNVVSTSLIPMCWPSTAPPAMRNLLEAACKAGGTSFYNSGIDPGWATTMLPLGMLSIAGRVRSVRIQEISIYGDYAVVPIMRDVFGFGRPLDYERPIFAGGALHWWSGAVIAIAEALDVTLDDIRTVYEVADHPVDIKTTFGLVKAGTTAGVRFQIQGIVDNVPVIVMEHLNIAANDVAPRWSKPAGPNQGHQYRVTIDGEPSFDCNLTPGATGKMSGIDAGLMWVANHPINAISAVCQAAPGLLDMRALPSYSGHFVRPGQ